MKDKENIFISNGTTESKINILAFSIKTAVTYYCFRIDHRIKEKSGKYKKENHRPRFSRETNRNTRVYQKWIKKKRQQREIPLGLDST